jgi:integrase/recombinase XerD
MAKTTRFTPKQTVFGWRLNIPAKFSQTGKRQQLHYPTKAKALAVAEKLKKARDTFGAQAIAIAPSVSERAIAAEKLLAPLGIDLLDAVRRFVEMETRNRASLSVKDAVAAFRATGDEWSKSQSTAYKLRGEKLVVAFSDRMISTITGEELQKHLEDTTNGPGGFNQNLRLVRTIWNWSAKPPRKWCDTEAIKHLDAKGTVSAEVGTLTAAQAAKLLHTAEKHLPDCVPAFAIALFTGMRQQEIDRLTPGDITGEGITVPATSAKTKRRRFVQMPEPLAAWLKVYPVGQSVTPANWSRKEKAVRRLAGWKVWSNHVPTMKLSPPMDATPPDDLPEWPQNALRHTAATVSIALGKPIETLTFEHGHVGGLEMLRRHYVGAMPKAEALKIWALRPEKKRAKESAKKITHLKIA